MSYNTSINSIVSNLNVFELEESTFWTSFWLCLYLVVLIFFFLESYFCYKYCRQNLEDWFDVLNNEELSENVQEVEEIDSHNISEINGEKINVCFEVWTLWTCKLTINAKKVYTQLFFHFLIYFLHIKNTQTSWVLLGSGS